MIAYSTIAYSRRSVNEHHDRHPHRPCRLGTWPLDPVHSTIGFEVDYLGGTFRGQFRETEARLVAEGDSPVLTGSAKVASVDVKDENLTAHLQSPDFFDAERYPELSFESSEIGNEGDEVASAAASPSAASRSRSS